MKAISLARLLYRRYAKHDGDAALHLLTKLGRSLIPNYRFVFPEMAWWDHPRFNDYLARFDELGKMNSARRWMVHQLCRMTASIPGDTAECGVFGGASSYLICLANDKLGKTHHMFDSFEGLSTPGERDGTHWTAHDLSFPLDRVKHNLRGFSKVAYHPGWIPARFPDVEGTSFSFVHVDVDLEQPTFDSFRFFYPRLSPGGILLCDDYGFTTCPGATHALDEFFADKPEKMISLSAGGGFIIKDHPVGGTFDELALS